MLSTFEVLGREPMDGIGNLVNLFAVSQRESETRVSVVSIVEFGLSNLANVMCSLLSALRVISLVLFTQAIG